MRFSAVAALCAAPMALAGTLQAELYNRGFVGSELEVRSQNDQSSSNKGDSKDSDNNSNSKNSNSNSNAGTNIIIEQPQVTEVIVIWANAGGSATTSTVTQTVTALASAIAAAPAAAATHTVVVGGSAGLVYTPPTIEAAVGDMVIFQFESTNHTATQSAFTAPCEALAGGMDTGFVPNVNNSITPPPQVAMLVSVATPIWFYCKQSGHCGKGMTFSINPTANKTQALFQQMAIAQNGTGSAAAIVGGTASVSSSTVAATATTATAAASTSTSSSNTGLTSGTGTINSNGACDCSCLCAVAAFPDITIQGRDNFGGFSGAMLASALEA